MLSMGMIMKLWMGLEQLREEKQTGLKEIFNLIFSIKSSNITYKMCVNLCVKFGKLFRFS